MRYIERTEQIKSALSERPDLIATVKSIFEERISGTGTRQPIGVGNSRSVYAVGTCQLDPSTSATLLLKLNNELRRMSYADAARQWLGTELSEFGAFEMYYDFIVGNISQVSFRSQKGYEEYRKRAARPIQKTFSLDQKWGGAHVAVGDLGAIPYFQMAVRYKKKWFGCLTEGNPPVIKPSDTATDWNTQDEKVVLADANIFLLNFDSMSIRRNHRNVIALFLLKWAWLKIIGTPWNRLFLIGANDYKHGNWLYKTDKDHFF